MTTNILIAFVTAYVATGHPAANGHQPQTQHTVALPRQFPLGSKVQIDGHWYVGEDRTAKKYDGRFDIFMATRDAALQWGKRRMQVTVVTK
ncbi:MAG TPA: 3D domain-containing protein [Terracidiphilus sp.]|nr:3D domain-containing protein [Terracidiphilus sp.]